MELFLRTPYNYDMNAASDACGLACKDVSRTQQAFAEDADINTIVRRFGLDGPLPQNVRAPVYGDFTGLGDFQDAMNAIVLAKESFEAMPARVRARFENDPQRFVEFCSDVKNADEMAKLGLVTPEAFDRLAAEAKARELAAARVLVAEATPASAPVVAPPGASGPVST